MILSLEAPNIYKIMLRLSINGWWTNPWVLPIRRCNMSHFKCQYARNWKFFLKTELSQKNIWPPRSPDLTPADSFLWGLLKRKVYKNTPSHNRTTQRRYKPRDSSRQCRHFGKSIPEFGEALSSVLGCERRPVSTSIMSRSCFASFPVWVYTFLSHYLNNIIFIDVSLGPLATESPCIKRCFSTVYSLPTATIKMNIHS